MNIVFMVEEMSMKKVLDILLPQILPENVSFRVIPHEGKGDLEKSIPIKLKAWNIPDTRFVIVHDQDANDCVELKQNLLNMCKPYGRDVLIRIVCHELESWYFGDLQAVSKAYDKDLSALIKKRKFRIPDEIMNPKFELYKLIPEHQQLSGAEMISKHMCIDDNISKSFQVFVSGVRRFCVSG